MRASRKGGAARMEGHIERCTGLHIPHRMIHAILEADGEVQKMEKYHRRRAWIRWECSHSNMMWHTDFMLLFDGWWLIAYEDDASRRIVAFAVVKDVTADNAIAVLREGVERHGRPASIMTDHGSQFFANEAEGRRRGESAFEAELKRLNIRHVLARIAHPQRTARSSGSTGRSSDTCTSSRQSRRRRRPGRTCPGATSQRAGRSTAQTARKTPCRGWCTGTTTRGTTCRLTRARHQPWPTSTRCRPGV